MTVAAAVIVVGCSVVVIVNGVPRVIPRTTTNRSTPQPATAKPFAKPLLKPHIDHLKIPSLHVDAVVKPVGLTANGAVATLTSPLAVGWYNQGAYPGQRGSAILDGHVNANDGSPGVFYALSKLRAGDKIYFEGVMGTSIFVVRKRQFFPSDAQPAEVFNGGDRPYLNLITCAGLWDKKRKGFEKRLVVFAVAEDVVPN